MSKTVAQIFATNPVTTILNNDLFYLVQSPYTPGTDAAINGLSLKSLFLQTVNNLSDLSNVVLARGNLGLTSIATATPPLSASLGGTGVNNGVNTATFSGNLNFANSFTTSGNFAVTQTYTGITNVTFPTTGTLATTAQLLVSPLTTKGDIWTWTTTNARLPVGTIDGQILQVSSAAATGLAYSTATYPATALNAGRILRSNGTNYVDTTSTFADTYAASGFLYANGANNVAGLATANNGLPVTNNTGVPSILAGPGTTGNMLISNAAAAPSFTTFTMPTTIGASGSIYISNGTNIVSSTSLWPNTVGTSLHLLISNGTSNVYSTPAYPNASVTAGKLIISDGTNYIASTSIWPNTVGTSRKVIISDGTSNVYSTETYAVPGTSGNVMTSDGTNWISSPAAGVTLLTTKGDLFGFSTVNARVPVATGNGKVLQVDSTASVGVSYSTPTYPSASGSIGKLIISDGTNNVYSTPTFPNASATTRKIIVSDGTNWVASTETWAVPGTSGNFLSSDGTNWTSATLLALANGGSNAALTANNGGIVWSNATQFQILAGTATAGLALLSGATAAPTWSTKPPITSINVQTFSASATYTPTAGTKFIICEAQGGGGGAGGNKGNSAGNQTSGAGGSGNYIRTLLTIAQVGASAVITINSGGAGGTGTTPSNGSAGGSVTIAFSVGTLTANGGGGGTAITGSAAASSGVLGGAGGAVGTSQGTTLINEPGNPGGPGWFGASAVVPPGSTGASSLFGGGGLSAVVSGAGNNATGFGAGGSGANTYLATANVFTGGNGTNGYVVITEFIST